jgi:hypothetical protein
MTSAEIQLNPFLEACGSSDLRDGSGGDHSATGRGEPSHIVVPALHVNRSQVREIFARSDGPEGSLRRSEGTDERRAHLSAAEVPRPFLRRSAARIFWSLKPGSCRGGRVRRQRPHVPDAAAHHDYLAGIEKVLPRFQDLEVMLQVLARSATGERMNPYTSLWTGVAGRWPAEVPRGSARQRALVDLWQRKPNGRRCVHPLRGLHEYLPGLPADGRPRLWLGVSGPDRRDSHAAVDADAPRAVAALMPRRCAAPATRSARSRSIFPKCCSNCARRLSTRSADRWSILRPHVPWACGLPT